MEYQTMSGRRLLASFAATVSRIDRAKQSWATERYPRDLPMHATVEMAGQSTAPGNGGTITIIKVRLGCKLAASANLLSPPPDARRVHRMPLFIDHERRTLMYESNVALSA